ncbi:MAG: acetyltransferase [OCS116 cluster bacterium]|nr:acetyltransferase [OCS116 cluster bacterium]
MKKQLLLIGGGGHCRSVIDVIEQHAEYEIAGIIDNPTMVGKSLMGYKYLGGDDDLPQLFETYKYALVTIGQIENADKRITLFNLLSTIGYQMPVIISPLAYVSKHAEIDSGSVVMHHALVNAAATIGKNCIINSKALIEHDCHVGDHCHISTGAILNGGVTVQKNSFVGSNSTVIQDATISGFIKAGSLKK